MTGITAVVLTATSYARAWPGLEVLVHRCLISDAAGAQAARFDALAAVTTPHFFYLDDDDDLPANHLEVIERALLADAPLVYTDELVRAPDGGESLNAGGPYSQAAHLRNPLLVHHLAVCRTDAAQAAVARLPRGHYWPEIMLYWELAKAGWHYLPEVGYIWNKSVDGMNTWPSSMLSQMRTVLWCKAHP